jgi:hypothetical protein
MPMARFTSFVKNAKRILGGGRKNKHTKICGICQFT